MFNGSRDALQSNIMSSLVFASHRQTLLFKVNKFIMGSGFLQYSLSSNTLFCNLETTIITFYQNMTLQNYCLQLSDSYYISISICFSSKTHAQSCEQLCTNMCNPIYKCVPVIYKYVPIIYKRVLIMYKCVLIIYKRVPSMYKRVLIIYK